MSAFVETLKSEAAASTATSIKALSERRSEVFHVNPYVLKIKPNWNSRDMRAAENVQHIEMLARSIADCGVQEPLTVFSEDGSFYLSDGHCRLLAAKFAVEKMGAEIRTVPVKTEERGSNEGDRLASQLVRNSGKPFTDLEKAVVFLRLQRMGWSDDQIASRAGMVNGAAVARIIELNELPEEMKALINDGTISASQAKDAAKKVGDAKEAAARIAAVKAEKEAAAKAKAEAQAQKEAAAKAKAEAAAAAGKRLPGRPKKEKALTNADFLPGGDGLASPPATPAPVRVTAKDLGDSVATQRNKVAVMVKNIIEADDTEYNMFNGRVRLTMSAASWEKLTKTVGHESDV